MSQDLADVVGCPTHGANVLRNTSDEIAERGNGIPKTLFFASVFEPHPPLNVRLSPNCPVYKTYYFAPKQTPKEGVRLVHECFTRDGSVLAPWMWALQCVVFLSTPPPLCGTSFSPATGMAAYLDSLPCVRASFRTTHAHNTETSSLRLVKQRCSVTSALFALSGTQPVTSSLLLQARPLEGASVGDVVAAPFPHDKSWYRARVVETAPERTLLYYVDFGDTDWAETAQLRPLG